MREPWLFARVCVPGRLYRVSRPGRSLGSGARVSEEVVERWVRGIAERLDAVLGEDRAVDYVCLLGRKPHGKREIADFYDARGPWDGDAPGTLRKPPWEAFLNSVARGRLIFRVRHFPSIDGTELPVGYPEEAAGHILGLLRGGRPVLVGCSAGCTRTGAVLTALMRILRTNGARARRAE